MPTPDPRFGLTNPHRTLSPRQVGRVRAHFMWWANTHRLRSPQPPPTFDEVRWSDDFKFLYVSKLSGLDAMLNPATPTIDAITHAVYRRDGSDAVAKLLDIIHEVAGEVVL